MSTSYRYLVNNVAPNTTAARMMMTSSSSMTSVPYNFNNNFNNINNNNNIIINSSINNNFNNNNNNNIYRSSNNIYSFNSSLHDIIEYNNKRIMEEINDFENEDFDDAIGDLRISNIPSPLEIDPMIASLSSISLKPSSGLSLLDQAIDESSSISDSVEHDSIECIKRTYQPSVLIRKRRHGFMHRMSSKAGRRVLQRRITHGRSHISA
ncbi:hypothetical protein SAMD00019534_022130 [Acytostelium subglobosum LB1]|uniref:hypothetical protein n=1 Tax=Acytostelium subglobosum LB1 TaxID=1410327 RepID=UPI000644BF50|nr:hypothetical protein SAMD00019534_022130 [Acytostelium subglobosum LB1]GAM19038.1 hypothetical protein SAMD00019534_022130 [Acytostelium subglobosum LB1]|eukprot:XP_012756965.1 hypothetical protein SAMD00019534_022130 [Acytostelium subglobosum LB1]